MRVETASLIAVSVLLIASLAFIFFNAAQREKKSKATNYAVNNSLADLIEDHAIMVKNFSTSNPLIMMGTGKVRSNYAQEILDIGFKGESIITAKTFHENLYENRDVFLNSLDQAIEFHHIDTETPPQTRAEEGNQTIRNLLPFLILGDMQGSDGSIQNPKYITDENYIGYPMSASILMTTT